MEEYSFCDVSAAMIGIFRLLGWQVHGCLECSVYSHNSSMIDDSRLNLAASLHVSQIILRREVAICLVASGRSNAIHYVAHNQLPA